MHLGGPELLILLAVVLILFGGRRLPELGRGVGEGFRLANLRAGRRRPWKVADFRLRGADLRGEELRGARLAGADLRGANLAGAALLRPCLRDADLSGANLRASAWGPAPLLGADLAGVRYDAATRWPRGFHPARRCRLASASEVTPAALPEGRGDEPSPAG
jgi:TatA/E family protein of Tat protein translocase